MELGSPTLQADSLLSEPPGKSRINLQMYNVWITTLRLLTHVAKLHPTLCDPTDFSLPGSSVHGILQARILESVFYFPRASF